MHKFMICFNEHNNKSREYAGLLMEAFASFMQYDPAHPDLVISVGGDRTMLDTIQAYVGQIETTYFVGLHTGNLGFYSDYKEDEWERLVEDVKYHHYEIARRNLLEVCVNGTSSQKYLALNEIRLEQNRHTLVLDVLINGEHLERFRGNGLCVSTPAGSTAYNRALGGSIVSCSIRSLQLAEIAGIHHNAYRSLENSLVLDDQTTITLIPVGQNQAVLGVDRLSFEMQHLHSLTVRVADCDAMFLRHPHFSLTQRLKKAFISEK